MTKLSETQATILRTAAKHPERIALPLPDGLRGGAAAKVVGALLAKGFLQECDANMRVGDPLWRTTGDGHGNTLVATDAGLAAIGIEQTAAQTAHTSAPQSQGNLEATDAQDNATPVPAAHTQREGTKQAALVAMLRAPEGATLAEIVAATGWQKHTARGAMSGALKKRLGLIVTSETEDQRGRVYRIL